MQNKIIFKTLLYCQFFVFFILLIVGLYLFGMSQSSRALPETIPGMQKTSAICLILAPFWLVPTVGLRQKAAWAWWLGFIVNLFAFVFLGWALGFGISEGDLGTLAFPGTFLVLTILHLLSRPTTWKAMELAKYPSFAKKTT